MAWLADRYETRLAADLVDDERAMQHIMARSRAVVLPRKVRITESLLAFAPKLQAIGRLHSDNADIDVCREAGVRLVQPLGASSRAHAEFLLASLLLLMRRGLLPTLCGKRAPLGAIGQELHGSTIGLLGMTSTAHTLASLLTMLGAKLIGYDPALTDSSPMWESARVRRVTLPELLSSSDAVSVQMLYAPTLKRFLDEAALSYCKPGQLWVGVSRSALFDETALAHALSDGRIESCLLDGAEAQFAPKGSKLRALPNLILTPRLGANTAQARIRASWHLAHRIDDILSGRDEPGREPTGYSMPAPLGSDSHPPAPRGGDAHLMPP